MTFDGSGQNPRSHASSPISAEPTTTEFVAAPDRKARDLSIDYLRTTLTLMVIAHHSMLAYTTWGVFDRQNVFRSTAPIVDESRWIVFDYLENFNDVFFMSLMFFISGLFVYPAIRRHGALAFARDRIVRLGLPFAVAVCVLMPVALYPSWELGTRNSGFADFYRHLARSRFRVGPPWFIWVLLFFDLIIALFLVPGQQWLARMGNFIRKLQQHSVVVFVGMVVLSAVLYLPLLARFGFSRWTVLFTSPFAFQESRIALYGLWFMAGLFVGVPGIATGLLSRSGSLVRSWKGWIVTCATAYAALSFLPKFFFKHGMSLADSNASEAMFWVLSCVASCFAFLAFFRAIELRPSRLMDSLSRSAYVMYLVHYVFLTWTQKFLLALPVHAAAKAAIVFVSTVTLSWCTAQVLIRIPGVRAVI